MHYRLIKENDIKPIFLLGKSYFALKSEYSWDRSVNSIRKYLKKSFGLGMVCCDKTGIVGFVLVEKNYSSQKPNVARLTYIFVDKKYRHQHIASVLLDSASEKLKRLGKTDMITDVYTKNTTSLDFFESNEFQIKEKRVILSRKIK